MVSTRYPVGLFRQSRHKWKIGDARPVPCQSERCRCMRIGQGAEGKLLDQADKHDWLPNRGRWRGSTSQCSRHEKGISGHYLNEHGTAYGSLCIFLRRVKYHQIAAAALTT